MATSSERLLDFPVLKEAILTYSLAYLSVLEKRIRIRSRPSSWDNQDQSSTYTW